jgi:PadR family transcriptional regulator, regulatory protein PadR
MYCIGAGAMNNDTQIVKGILEGCILEIIRQEEMYGYKTVEILNDFGFEVNEATVYPILTRMQNKGFLEIEIKPSPYGPARKYYSLTYEGEENLKEFKDTWERIKNIVIRIMEGDDNDNEK